MKAQISIWSEVLLVGEIWWHPVASLEVAIDGNFSRVVPRNHDGPHVEPDNKRLIQPDN